MRRPGGAPSDRENPRRFAGFVLAGGRSSRMGEDKAMLPYGDTVLVAHVAKAVDAVAGPVTIVGSPQLYQGLGLPVLADLRPGLGPLAGIETALAATGAEWNLVAACDMPRLTPGFLARLLAEIEGPVCQAVVPVSENGPEPLCALWRKDCLAEASRCLDEGRRKLQWFMERLEIRFWNPGERLWNENLNTPGDWRRHWQELHAAAPETRR